MEYKIRMINKDPKFDSYFVQAINWDLDKSWLLDSVDENSLFWDIEDIKFSAFSYGLFINNKIAGICLINFDSDDDLQMSYSLSVIVSPMYRMKGIGTYFVNHVLGELNPDRVKEVNAEIYSNNIASISLVSKIGFNFVGKDGKLLQYKYVMPTNQKKKVI